MAFTIDGTNGLTFPDASTQATRAVSRSGDTMTGALISPMLQISGGGQFGRGSIYSDSNWGMLLRGAQASNGAQYELAYSRGSDDVKLLQITPNGAMTVPLQPSFEVWNNTGSQLNTNNVQYDFDTVGHNIGGHFNLATNKFTAPVTGRYLISFRSLTNNTSGSPANIQVRINDNYIYYAGHNHVANNWIMEGFTGVVQLAANDTVDVFVVVRSAHYGRGYGSFSGHLLG